MKPVLIDTCIWSLSLRGKSPRNLAVAKELTQIIYAERARIFGPIRQEVLSGYSDFNQYSKLKDKLSYFPNAPIIDDDYICAAEFSNLCRKNGVQGSHIDLLICAVAYRLKWSIYTCDKDFVFYDKYIPIMLHVEGL